MVIGGEKAREETETLIFFDPSLLKVIVTLLPVSLQIVALARVNDATLTDPDPILLLIKSSSEDAVELAGTVILISLKKRIKEPVLAVQCSLTLWYLPI